VGTPVDDPSSWALVACEAPRGVQYEFNQSINQTKTSDLTFPPQAIE